MKKLSVSMAMILCLALCVFAFASCGKKTADATTADPGTTPATTVAPTEPEATEPVHVHTPAAEYTIDRAATCAEAGSKSKHCTECNAIIAETAVAIPIDETAHVIASWNVTEEATLLHPTGSKTGHCSVCDQDVIEAIAFKPTVQTWTDASSGEFDFGKKNVVNEVMNGDHFYPTDDNASGKDLLVEYSILWNESMLNFLGGSANPWIHTFVGSDTVAKGNNLAYWSPVADNNNADCKFAGGFEYGTMRTSEPGNPYPQMTKPVGDSIDEFPNIGGNNGGDGTPQGDSRWGWHRVQIRLHIDVTNADALKADATAGATAATYKCTTTIYIDGLLVSILSSDSMTDKNNSYDNKLFTAASDGQGGIVYTDIAEDKWIHPIRFNSTKAKEGTTVYVVIGDVSATCGTEFVQNVVRIEDPADATLTVAEGVDICAKVWFGIACDEHVWDGNFAQTRAATLLEDGEKVEHCSVCGAEHAVETVFVPAAKVWTDASSGTYNDDKMSIVDDVLDGDHFYPTGEEPEGKDLLVEYSILWNQSMLNFVGSNQPHITTRIGNSGGGNSNNLIYWSPVGDNTNADCKFAGGFEYGALTTSEAGNPYPRMTTGNPDGVGDSYEHFPNIGGADQANPEWGWHRVALRLHEEVTNEAEVKDGAAATYKFTSEIYIDGTLVSRLSGNVSVAANYLYTAQSDGEGGITYADIASDRWIHPFRFNNIQAKTGTTIYMCYTDLSVTCGTEFVQNVEKVATPTAKTVTVAEGVEFPAAVYFKLAD